MRKLVGFILFFLFIGAGAYLYALFFVVPGKIQGRLSEALARSGFEQVKYARTSASPGSVIFHEIRLDEKGFGAIEQVEISYSPLSFLLNGSGADLVKVKNLRLTGEISEDSGLTLAGWAIEDDLLKRLAGLSAETVLFEGAVVDLFSPVLGGLKLVFEGQAKRGGGENGEVSFLGRVRSKQAKLSFDSSVTGTLSEGGQLDITAKADELQVEVESLKLNRSSAQVNFVKYPDTAPTIAVQALATSLSWRNLPFGDMNIVIELKDGDFNLFAEGKAQGTEKINFSVGIKSGGEEKDTAYEVVITPENFSLLTSFLFRNGILKEGQAIPPLLANLKNPSLTFSFDDKILEGGETQGVWSLESEAQGLAIEGIFTKTDKAAAIWEARCKKASFTDEAEEGSLAPPFYTDIPLDCFIRWDGSVQPPQALWAAKTQIEDEEIHFGPLHLINITGLIGEKFNGNGPPERRSSLSFSLPLRKEISHKGKIALNLDATGAGLFESLDLSIYGGHVRAENFDLKGLSFPSPMTFKISDIDLEKYTKGLNLKTLSVTGRLGGVIPLFKNKDGLTIKSGLIQSQEPGVIKMPESLSLILFPGTDKQMTKIRAALKNYHYEFFELRLDGTVSGGVMISLNSRGNNPLMKDKKPIEMNFQIETQIGLLVRHMIPEAESAQ